MMTRALPAVDAALSAVAEELNRHRQGTGRVSNPAQLQAIRKHLETLRDQLATGRLPDRQSRLRGLGHTITDSWPFDSELAAVILAAEQAYLAEYGNRR